MAAKADTYNSAPDSIRIGLLCDMPASINRIRFRMAEIVAEEYGGRVKDRPIEFVPLEFIGAPTRSTRNAIEAYQTLVDAGCLIMTGTNHSDNSKVVLPVADERQVTIIQNGASDQVISEYMFSVNWGYMANETYILANYCRAKNYDRVCVVTDTAWHCREYVEYFTDACKRWNIEIVTLGIASEFIGDEMRGQLEKFAADHARLKPDAVVVLGSSPIAEAYSWAAHKAGVTAARLMNADFPRIYWPPEHGILPEAARKDRALLETFTGWIGLSVYDEGNRLYQDVQRRYEAKFGEPIHLKDPGATYYDAVRACVEAIRMAPILSPQGVKIGLEKVKQLPAAVGTDANALNFGPYDHMAYKGITGAVLRRITDGTQGISVLEHRFDTSL